MNTSAVIVQGITTHWTKAARGAPLAAERAAVPEAAEVPAADRPTPGTAFVHTLEAHEEHGFSLEEAPNDPARPLPVTAFATRVSVEDGLVLVTGLAVRWSGWPGRERERVLLRLAPGEWGRCLRNNRIGGAHEWTYTKFVLNVAHLAVPAGAVRPRMFLDTEPIRVVDEQAPLR